MELVGHLPIFAYTGLLNRNRIFIPRSLEGGGQIAPFPAIFLALNFCCFTDCQKLWYNSSLFVSTSFDAN